MEKIVKNQIGDFFALRPFFSIHGLRMVWWLFLLVYGFHFYGVAYASIQHIGQYSTYAALILYLPNLLEFVVQIAIVRVLLEVALLRIGHSSHNPD